MNDVRVLPPVVLDDGGSTQAVVSAYLHREAALLDDRLYEEWIKLFDADSEYLMPGPYGDDPDRYVAIIGDDYQSLRERVTRLIRPANFSQNPPSNTARLVSNVLIVAQTEEDIVARATFLLAESRSGGPYLYTNHKAFYAGHYELDLKVADDGHLSYRRKLIRLIDNESALANVSFLW